MLFGDSCPVPGSGHHSLSIDGSKSKAVTEFETSSIGGQVINSQYVRIRGVRYQILYISPCQIRTVRKIIIDALKENDTLWREHHQKSKPNASSIIYNLPLTLVSLKQDSSSRQREDRTGRLSSQFPLLGAFTKLQSDKQTCIHLGKKVWSNMEA